MNEERIGPNFASHDPISDLLVHFGIVGLTLAAVIAFISLRTLRQQVLSIHSPYGRRLCAAVLGMALGVAVTSILSGSRLTTFPINALFWFFLASVAVIADHDRRHWEEEQAANDEPTARETAATQPHSHLRRPFPAFQTS
jgi:hypothetical protein